MTHPHVRVRDDALPKRNWKTNLVVIAAVLFFGLLFAIGPHWSRFVEDTHETAVGQILESRIVVRGSHQSQFGGAILYCIEVHVRYELKGRIQDRWMVASEVTSNRDMLALQQPKTCEVHWAPHHPENPKCLLP